MNEPIKWRAFKYARVEEIYNNKYPKALIKKIQQSDKDEPNLEDEE